MNTWFITGCSGYVGSHLLKYLHSQPNCPKLKVLSRSSSSDEKIKATNVPVTLIAGDLNSIDEMATAMKGCSVVIHCAAKVDPFGDWQTFVDGNIIGTQNVITAAKMAKVKKIINVATEALLLTGLGNGCYDNVDETAPYALDPPFYAPYTKSKAIAEKNLLAANSESLQTVSVRPRFVWGAEDTTLLPRFIDALKKGTWRWFTPLDYKSSTCHIDNLCEGIVCAVNKGKGGHAYFLTDGEPWQFKEFITKYVETQDFPVPKDIGSISPWYVWYALAVIENIPWLDYGRSYSPVPVNRQILGLMAQSVIVNDAKARREIGYIGKKSIQEGMDEMKVLTQ